MSRTEIEKDNSQSVNAKVEAALKRALTKIGMMAETYAKMLCPVDTGLLRNSITFALDGEQANKTTYMNDEGTVTGTYEGTAPEETGTQMTLYVGTNVQYAPYQEFGHHTVKGRWIPPQAFLKPAMENHQKEYEQVIKAETRNI